MLHNNVYQSRDSARGFTLVELVVVLTLTFILATTFYTFFSTNLFTYLDLQTDASNFTEAAGEVQRISNVVRGLTDIISASDNDLQMYAYFYPQDANVSLVHYYLNAAGTQLLVDVTPMTANPPSGSPITAQKKTYTIIDSFLQSTGVKLFNYYDATNTLLTTPVSDETAIKAIKVNIGVKATLPTSNEAVSLQVSLRNRKTNL